MLFNLNNLSLVYQGRPVLNNISFSIEHGERVAFIGKSGVGKSTLLKHLRHLQGQDCAWCPQHLGLVPNLSVYHNIYMGGLERHSSLYNLANLIKPLKKPQTEIQAITDRLQLSDKLNQTVESLSGGQQQRVAIARALYQQRELFLGDEPVSGLDNFQGENLLSHLSNQHATLLVALHDTEQALALCDRLIGLKDGGIFFDKSCDEISPGDLSDLYS